MTQPLTFSLRFDHFDLRHTTRVLSASVVRCLPLVALLGFGCGRETPSHEDLPPRYTGSRSCRECHERFYKLWAPSHHGKAMQPVTPEFVADELTPQEQPIAIGEHRYLADIDKMEIAEMGAAGTKAYPMIHAMGGKNVYFFLTPLERGRLQVMPISYNVEKKIWYDTTASMVRHFTEEDAEEDEPIYWRDPLLTFNAACYGCHVSQFSKNYDPETDTYHTEWKEPGINCEACHGPGEAHIRVCREAAPQSPEDLKIILWKDFTVEQKNDACAPCHAKMQPLTPTFMPGDRFFDHYDLVCMEDRDFYPDGRDLGENYTHTQWMMNPCAISGQLDCTHCHTSSGRYRFAEENPNGACLPCHQERVANATEHTHHEPPPKGPKCIDCHMPMTAFSQMRRSDHSFRPPSPKATLAFGSPNACGLCHDDMDTEALAKSVREWHPEETWTKRIIYAGKLLDDARHGKWERLDAMLNHMLDAQTDPAYVTAFVRVLVNCPDARIWPAIKQCLEHTSPLVRASAASTLRNALDLPTVLLLTEALADDYRLVRVRAAGALSLWPRERLSEDQRARLKKAEQELFTSFEAMPDNWATHYNRGNYLGDRGQIEAALRAYERALDFRDDILPPYINAAVTASRLGKLDESLRFLQGAYRLEPDDAGVNFNLGLALAEQGDITAAEKHLRAALKGDGTKGPAAYNLAVIVAAEDVQRAVRFCRIAVDANPDNPRYAYTLAFYLREADQRTKALQVLAELVDTHPGYVDAWALLAETHLSGGETTQARDVYRRMTEQDALPADARAYARQQLMTLQKDES